MRRVATSVWLLLCGWASTVTPAQAGADDLKAFPAAGPGRQRIVIRVPDVPNPEDFKVEVMLGKTIMVDCNRHSFGGTVTREEAQGWGYSYYVLDALGGMASTMMACPPGTPMHQEFARVPAELLASLRYNPALPIVVYVPDGVEVRYRIWSAGAETRTAGAQ
jgi:ecotin